MSHKLAVALLCAPLFASCAAVTNTTFQPYTGSKPVVGAGGVLTHIGGFEYWQHGAPDRPFRVLGIIEQSAPAGLGAAIVLGDYNRSEIIAKLRQEQADGIIELDRTEPLSGVSATRNYGSGGYDIHTHHRAHKVLAAFQYVR